MFDRIRAFCVIVFMMLALAGGMSDASAQDAVWQVTKASGDVSIAGSGVQPAALTSGTAVKPGDTIRTGRNGRVLLTRGPETILIEPNSVLGIPVDKKDGMSTTILQKSGSLLLEVEKRNVKHFEVETPYLAAVVKGTQFRVTVNGTGARVDVLRGQVDVADFKSGNHALVLPGQAARVPSNGRGGLTLSGSGTFSPILKGEPRTPSIRHEPAGREASPAQRDPSKQSAVRDEAKPSATRDPARQAIARDTSAPSAMRDAPRQSVMQSSSNGRLQLTAPIGEVKLDIHKATQGLARAQGGGNFAGRAANANASAGPGPASAESGSAANAMASGAGFGTASGGLDGGSLGGGAISSGGIAGGAVSAGGAVASSGGSGGGGGGSAAGGGGGSAGGGGLAGVVGGVTQTVGGVTQTVGGVLGGLHLSDIRLKRDIVQVGRLSNGLGLYRYRYLWSDVAYVGVMAQEVALVRSDAVVRGTDGYLRVDYAALDIPFATWDEWTAATGRN